MMRFGNELNRTKLEMEAGTRGEETTPHGRLSVRRDCLFEQSLALSTQRISMKTAFYLTTETGYFIRFTSNEAPPIYATLFIPDSKLTPDLRAKLSEGNGAVSQPVTAYEGVTKMVIVD